VDGTKRRFVVNVAAFGLTQVLVALRTLIVLPAVGPRLGPEAYGILGQIIIASIFLNEFVSFRLEMAVVRKLAAEDDPRRFSRRFYGGLALVAAGGGLFALAATTFSEELSLTLFGGREHHRYAVACGALLLPFTINLYLRAYWRAIQRITTVAIITAAQAIVEVLLMIAAVLLGHGLIGAIVVLVAVNAVAASGMLVTVIRALGWAGIDWRGLRSMLAYSTPLMPNTVLMSVMQYADRIVITHHLGLAALGAYYAAVSLCNGLALFSSPVGYVLFPAVSRLWDRGDREEARAYFTQATRAFALLAIPACVGLTFIASPLLRTLATAEFEPSNGLVLTIGLAYVSRGVFRINVFSCHLANKTHYVLGILAVGTAVAVSMNLLLVPWLGLLGAGVSVAVSDAISSGLLLRIGARLIGYSVIWKDVAKAGLAAAGMAAVLHLLPDETLVDVAVLIVAGVVSYTLLLLALRAFSRDELRRLFEVVARRRKDGG